MAPFDGYGRRTPTAALTRPRTVYVDSVAGNDNGQGTLASPWRTLRRAWVERLQYVKLEADFVIQLLGVGPYLVDFPMGASVCGAEGRFLILGDRTADLILESGTATGDMVANVVPTSAIVGSHPNWWLRFMTGACAGCEFEIIENAANSVTVSNSIARGVNGAIANGDQWRIVEPMTVIEMQPGVVGAESFPQINNWEGTFGGGTSFVPQPCHWFYGVKLSAAVGATFRVNNSQIGLGFCFLLNGGLWNSCSLQVGGMAEQTRIPGAANSRLFGSGAWSQAGMVFSGGTQVQGVYHASSGSNFGYGSRLIWAGGNMGTPTANSILFHTGAQLEAFGNAAEYHRLRGTLNAQSGAFLRINGLGPWNSVVTAGSCLAVTRAAQVLVEVAWTGSTADAAGYGVDVRGGGKCLFRNQTPQLTGGTAGSDLRTTNVPVAANAALNANGLAVGNAADALLGEVLARVA